MFEALGLPLDEETRKLYSGINKQLWLEHEKGSITKEYLVSNRFRILFERLGADADGVKAESVYRDALGRGTHLVDGALEVCRALAEKYALHIVTNGIYDTQMRRLEASGLAALARNVFVSEKVGYSKPSRAFFEYAFSCLPGERPEESLIIGDSLSSDMQGGVNAGIDTCWFNPGRRGNPDGVPVTYEIASLRELTSMLM